MVGLGLSGIDVFFPTKKYLWPEVEVVITFPTIWGSGVSWWRVDGAPIEWSLPFPWHIDWHRLVVEVSIDRLLEGMVCRLGPRLSMNVWYIYLHEWLILSYEINR